MNEILDGTQRHQCGLLTEKSTETLNSDAGITGGIETEWLSNF